MSYIFKAWTSSELTSTQLKYSKTEKKLIRWASVLSNSISLTKLWFIRSVPNYRVNHEWHQTSSLSQWRSVSFNLGFSILNVTTNGCFSHPLFAHYNRLSANNICFMLKFRPTCICLPFWVWTAKKRRKIHFKPRAKANNKMINICLKSILSIDTDIKNELHKSQIRSWPL